MVGKLTLAIVLRWAARVRAVVNASVAVRRPRIALDHTIAPMRDILTAIPTRRFCRVGITTREGAAIAAESGARF